MPMVFDGRRHPDLVKAEPADLDSLGHDDLVSLALERGFSPLAKRWKTETLRVKLKAA